MKKILLAGATGQLGKFIFRELKQQGYDVRVMARNLKKAQLLFPDPEELVLADATKPVSLEGSCEGINVVISAIGKSVSLRNQGSASFQDIDYQANLNLLREAQKADVKQFIYISAYGTDLFHNLAYCKAHFDFEKALRKSGLHYTILQPVALFSAFEEVAAMARKGRIASLGKGDKKTNPIFEGDLAKVVVANIDKPSSTIPVGGPVSYTRLEIVKIACEAAGYTGRIPNIPFEYVNSLLPLVRMVSRNLFDKLAFMVAVSKVDCLAPPTGELSLEAYFELEPQLSN